MRPLHLPGALRRNVDAETGGWGFAPLQLRSLDTALRAAERGAPGLGRGHRRWGWEWGLVDRAYPPLPAPLLLHRFRNTSCSHPQPLASEILHRATLGWDRGHCALNGCVRDPECQAEIGGLPPLAAPSPSEDLFSLCQGVGDCFIFIFLRGQRDETKTPWFSPKPLTAAVRKGRAGRAGGWGWRCPEVAGNGGCWQLRPSLLPLRRLQIGRKG